jgi:hypothetical protein
MNICTTIKNGTPCPFMGRHRCGFNDGKCNPVIDKCEGCTNTTTYGEKVYCNTYMNPESKWVNGRCPMCTVKIEVKIVEQKINPLKASKKASKSKKPSTNTKTGKK